MPSEIVNGSSCGIHGCQQVTITRRCGGDMKVNTPIVGGGSSVSVGQINTNFCTSLSLVCRTSQGLWEYLMVNEGEIMLIDGQRVMVLRKR